MSRYNLKLITEASQQAIAFALLNLIFASIVALGLGVSVKYGLIAVGIAGIVAFLIEKQKVLIFAPTVILIGFLHPIIAKYGIGAFTIITLLSSIIIYGFGYLKCTKYLTIFPRPIFIGITFAASFFSFSLALKYLLGLKANIIGEYYYLNVMSLYKNLKFINWRETLIGMSTVIAFFFFEKFELKSWAFIFSLFISVIFCYCLASQGYDVATIDNSLNYIMPEFIVNLSFNSDIPIFSNIKVALSSLRNFEIEKLFFYITNSLLIAIVVMLESTITIKVYDNDCKKKANSDLMMYKLAFINIIVSLGANFIVSMPLARNLLVKSSPIRLINLLQAFFILVLIKFGYGILGYIPIAGLAAIMVIVSYKISNIDKLIWFMRFGTIMEKMILSLVVLLCVVLNMIEGFKLGLIIAAISVLYRFAFKQIKEYLKIDNNINIIPLENKIKNSMTYRINEPAFLGIVSDSVGNLTIENDHPENLIIDITSIQELDTEGIRSLDTMLLKQIHYFKEVIICCNDLLLNRIRSEIKAPVRIILSSTQDS